MEEKTEPKDVSKTKRSQRFRALTGLVIFVILVGAVALVTKSHNSPAHIKTAQVNITAKGFEPATLVVKKGTKVTWTNTDKALHQIGSNPYPKDTDLPGLKSEILNNNQSYTYTADTTGNFGYHDQLKPTINGTIVVQK